MRLASGLLAAIAVFAVAPGVADAAPCPFEGPLQPYQREPVAFVGQAVERRDATVVLSVSDGFKGVASGDVVEVVDDDGYFARPATTRRGRPAEDSRVRRVRNHGG